MVSAPANRPVAYVAAKLPIPILSDSPLLIFFDTEPRNQMSAGAAVCSCDHLCIPGPAGNNWVAGAA